MTGPCTCVLALAGCPRGLTSTEGVGPSPQAPRGSCGRGSAGPSVALSALHGPQDVASAAGRFAQFTRKTRGLGPNREPWVSGHCVFLDLFQVVVGPAMGPQLLAARSRPESSDLRVPGCLPQTVAVSQHFQGSSVTLPAICCPHGHPPLVPLARQTSVASLLLFVHTKLEDSEKCFITSVLGTTGLQGTWGPSPQSAQTWTAPLPLLARWGRCHHTEHRVLSRHRHTSTCP